jgi:UPF0042 nucleotide-binding protein
MTEVPVRPGQPTRLIVVSGLSGSGKSTAIRALEDIGFFCVDNLPVLLLEQFVSLSERANLHNIAVVIDVREGAFLPAYEQVLGRVIQAGHDVQSLFLTCKKETLIRRFKETRRQHPLQGNGTITSGIEAEEEVLRSVRHAATQLMDTSEHNVHELRRRVQDIYRTAETSGMNVLLQSFGFKHGLPTEADYVFDVRFLSNPYFVEGLRELDGRDDPVSSYVRGQPGTVELIELFARLTNFVLPRLEQDGRSQVVIAVGCTGGRHRSVALVAWLKERLSGLAWPIRVSHRDLERRK